MTQSLDLKIGQKFTLTPADFTLKLAHSKSPEAKKGFAIDAHIKSLLKEKGINVPASQYAPYDFEYKGTKYDIKSYAKSSITIGPKEYDQGVNEINDGKDLIYAVFQQKDGDDFIFKGFVSLKALIKSNKIRNSQFNDTYYFSIGSAPLL